jgi:hypothetical protein
VGGAAAGRVGRARGYTAAAAGAANAVRTNAGCKNLRGAFLGPCRRAARLRPPGCRRRRRRRHRRRRRCRCCRWWGEAGRRPWRSGPPLGRLRPRRGRRGQMSAAGSRDGGPPGAGTCPAWAPSERRQQRFSLYGPQRLHAWRRQRSGRQPSCGGRSHPRDLPSCRRRPCGALDLVEVPNCPGAAERSANTPQGCPTGV